MWRKRLETPRTFPRDLTLALRGLGHMHDADSLTSVSAIALDLLRPSQIRLEAAQAAEKSPIKGWETAAEQLCTIDGPTRNSTVCAPCGCWRDIRRNPPRRLHLELAGDSKPAVAAAALNG